MTDPCHFCEMAAGRVKPLMVHEDADLMVFLDTCPIREGHLQIVPRAHYPYFDDLPQTLIGKITSLAQRIAKAQKRVYGVQRVGFLFTGGDIPHAHAHIVPMVEKTDITSRRYIAEKNLTFRDTPRPPDAEMVATANAIRRALEMH